MSDTETQGRVGAEAIALADELGDAELQRLGRVLRLQEGILTGAVKDSMPAGEEALATWPDNERRPERAVLLGLMGLNHYWLGEFDAAAERSSSASTLALEANSQNAFLLGAPHRGLALAGLGRYEEAISHLDSTLRRAREAEYVPRLTSRCAGMFSGVLHDVFSAGTARDLSAETVELSAAGGFPASGMFARMDLLAADAADGDFGAVETTWSVLWDDTAVLRGWHEWLARGRLLQSRAEFLLATGKADDAAAAAGDSVAWWRRYDRPKYLAFALATLGCANLGAGRPVEGLAALAEARVVAERLASPSVTWRVLAPVVAGLMATGDDNAAALAHAELTAAVEGIAAGLTEERRARFLGARPVAAALAAGG
jgi:tetratricopeptide (TPR) repeat protein